MFIALRQAEGSSTARPSAGDPQSVQDVDFYHLVYSVGEGWFGWFHDPRTRRRKRRIVVVVVETRKPKPFKNYLQD